MKTEIQTLQFEVKHIAIGVFIYFLFYFFKKTVDGPKIKAEDAVSLIAKSAIFLWRMVYIFAASFLLTIVNLIWILLLLYLIIWGCNFVQI